MSLLTSFTVLQASACAESEHSYARGEQLCKADGVVTAQVPAHIAGFSADLYCSRTRQIALCDFLTRSFGTAVSSAGAGDASQSDALLSAPFPTAEAYPQEI